jgi:hypothetical protein
MKMKWHTKLFFWLCLLYWLFQASRIFIDYQLLIEYYNGTF